MQDFIYKKNIKCYKCTCAECGADRGYQPIRNVNARCVTCSNKSRGEKSDSFKVKMSIKMRGNKNGVKPEHKKSTPEEVRIKRKKRSLKASLRCRDRYNTDIKFRLTRVIRSRLKSAVKNNNKSGSAIKSLGCSISEFKEYMESKFKPGMSWNNWALDGWHIDHIVPLSSFDLSQPEELAKACHYTNLQPLWASENIRKGGSRAGIRL